jgi:predicted small secreted protein
VALLQERLGMTDINNDVKRLDGIVCRVVLYFVCLNLTLLMIITMSGCNTISGIGRDLQAVAQGTQDWMADEPSVNKER